MKIEYIEVPLSLVLKYYQKDFSVKHGSLTSFGTPLLDARQEIVVFKLFIDDVKRPTKKGK